MARLIKVDDFDNFREVGDFPPEKISEAVLQAVRGLDEKEELEPFIRSILFDPEATPHGPAEIVDILTHNVTVKGESGLAAFIIKGKSSSTVKHRDVAHQIDRLRKVEGLKFAVFGAVGVVQDAVKDQFSSMGQNLKLKYSFFNVIDLARLFVAYGFFCPRDANRISAGRCSKCGYSPKKRILNILPREALKALDYAHDFQQEAGLVVLPPGGGKTRIAAEDARNLGVKEVLFVAETHEILDVAKSEFEGVFSSKEVTHHREGGDLYNLNKVNLVTRSLIGRSLERIPSNAFRYIVVDEFHHAAAMTYRRIIEHFEPEFLLGLTATPFRADRQNILELCNNNMLVRFELRSGIENGLLSPFHYYGCFDENVDYSDIRHNGYKYNVRDLERALIILERNLAIIKKWRERVEGKPTLAFCCSKRHAHRVCESFNKQGIPAAVYLSDTNSIERKSLIKDLESGDLKVLCVVDVMNEGADIPYIECLLFLRPTESKRIFYQQLGRGLRRFVGKSHCTVIDFIGNFKNAFRIPEYQGLFPSTEEEFVLDYSRLCSFKQMYKLPLGCEVHFDEQVIELFADQILDPKHATRYNIGLILKHQYIKLARRLGYIPGWKDVNRNCLFAELYKLVFGSWRNFEKLMHTDKTFVRVLQM